MTRSPAVQHPMARSETIGLKAIWMLIVFEVCPCPSIIDDIEKDKTHEEEHLRHANPVFNLSIPANPKQINSKNKEEPEGDKDGRRYILSRLPLNAVPRGITKLLKVTGFEFELEEVGYGCDLRSEDHDPSEP